MLGAATEIKRDFLLGVDVDQVNKKGIPWHWPLISKGELGVPYRTWPPIAIMSRKASKSVDI